MKLIIVIFAICTVTLAAPAANSGTAEIVQYDSENSNDGYSFAFETSDGVARKEQGQLKNAGTEQEALSVRGSVTWIADDGQQYTLTYLADENGFQPEGAHLPKAL